MTPERWRRGNELFDSALDLGPGADEYLLAACAGDSALYGDVRRMLDEHGRSCLLDQPLWASGDSAKPALEASLGRRYQLIEELGSGGMGVVYSAFDRLGKSHVALKRVMGRVAGVDVYNTSDETATLSFADEFPNPDRTITSARRNPFASRLALAREFQVLASLRHPNVITVLDYGFDSAGQPFYTMELLAGSHTISQAAQAVPLREKLELIAQVLRALAYLHRRGILHRDLKPQNVLMGKVVKVLDFGLATPVVQAGGPISGTITHMAPELFQGQPPSEASDLYAVGIIAYEILTGVHPFGNKRALVIYGHLHSEVDYSVVPPEWGLEPFLRKLLAKNPLERWSSANEAIRALSKITGGGIAEETAETRESFIAAAEFVDREEDQAALRQSMHRALGGHGEIWLLEGESGIGKSRLLDELRDYALVQGITVAVGQAERHRAGYHIWEDPLRLLALQTDLADAEASILKVLVPDLDSLMERDVAPVTLNPQTAKDQILGVVRAIFERQKKPLLVLLEDVHWSTESIDVLVALAPIIGQAPVMIVASYRPEEFPRAGELVPGARVLRLGPLGKPHVRELARSILGNQGVTEDLVRFLARHSEGNLFFLVETVRALAEQAGELGRIGETKLPERIRSQGIQEVVERRISLVPLEHTGFLQLAAVLGREPEPAVLRKILGGPAVERGLAKCADLSLFEVRRNVWRFTHDKFREAVLRQIPPVRARELHLAAAVALEELALGETQYAALAYHFQNAGDREKEAYYCRLAGSAALARGVYGESRVLLQRALELQPTLPRPDRKVELDLLLRLGSVLITQCGWSAPEVRSTYDRAVELAAAIGSQTEVAPALIGLAQHFHLHGQLSEVERLAQRCLDLPGAANDPIIRQHARLMQGDCAVWLGEFVRDRHYADEIAQLYRTEQLPVHLALYGMNPRLSSMVSSTVGTWMLGYPDRARQLSRELIRLAAQDNNPFSDGIAYQVAGWVDCLIGDTGACIAHALALREIASANGFPAFQVLASALEGWVLAREGKGQPAVAKIRQAIQSWQSLNARLVLTLYYTLLADACYHANLPAAGLAAAAEALSGELGTEERCYEPELYRLQGELWLLTGDMANAVTAFERSIAIAVAQQATSFEFRTTLRLARILEPSERATHAQLRLRELYSWFENKGETPDQLAAREILGL